MSNDLNLSESDKAWLASAIDGEGSICERNNGRNKLIGISVANTNEEYVRHAANLMKAAHYELHTRAGAKIFQTELRSRPKVLTILRQISPYLIIKKDVAQRYIDWITANPILTLEERNRRISEGIQRKKTAHSGA